MIPFRFNRDFDVEMLESLYQHLRTHDNGVELTLRAPGGNKVDAAGKAVSGVVKDAGGRTLLSMRPKEGVVYLRRAGALKAPLIDFLKERGFDQDKINGELSVVCIGVYIALVAGLGFYYFLNAQMLYFYPVLLMCAGVMVAGLFLLSHSSKPGQEVWELPGMIMLVLGALFTAPACILAKPMIKTLGLKKLQYHLVQDNVSLYEVER
ncbi:hypothetical protein IEI94_05725 [Halomonas sp. ML-15]|uniref:hypothetical protein n=1 Tax=Halomonas sp. ML-15 TaxID=2773305 RepID=UPI0017472AB0|nr:hypothetical protein [Halomonas sp. ML-15]MBD3895345.1 hypothetical protein [Halomonas sp. ML-15]